MLLKHLWDIYKKIRNAPTETDEIKIGDTVALNDRSYSMEFGGTTINDMGRGCKVVAFGTFPMDESDRWHCLKFGKPTENDTIIMRDNLVVFTQKRFLYKTK